MAENIQNTRVAAVLCPTYDPELVAEKVAEAVRLAGGLPPVFRPGARVLIKPNLLSPYPPEDAVTTHPEVVAGLIKLLRRHGIEQIKVGDSPAGGHPWEKLWTVTGFSAMAAKMRVELVPFETVKRIQDETLGTIPVYAGLDDFDAVISVPKLKTHALTKITGAVKNSFGLVVGNAKANLHGKYPAPGKMAEFLAGLFGLLPPDFIVMDAIIGMEGDGPADGRPKAMGVILAGSDAVAVDTCACRAYGYDSTAIPMLVKGAELGLGCAQFAVITRPGDGWDKLFGAKARRSKADLLNCLPEVCFHFLTFFLNCRPAILQEKCVQCGLCAKVCSQQAIQLKGGLYRVYRRQCVLCMCCLEACPRHAVELLSPGLIVRRFLKKFFPTGR